MSTVGQLAHDGPLLSILIPSYNQARFLEATLSSILTQRDPQVEIIVMDGGSSDETHVVLDRYRQHLAFWASEPDAGQSDALNKALEKAKGEWIGWQNSDDLYLAGSFAGFRTALARHPRADVLFGDCVQIDGNGQPLFRYRFGPWAVGEYLWRWASVTNQSAFFRTATIRRVGGWRQELHLAMDHDLYFRLAFAGARFVHVKEWWGAFRIHQEAKGIARRSESFETGVAVRQTYFPKYRPDGWRAWLWRAYYHIRRATYLACTGTPQVVVSALRRRLSGSQ